MCIYTYSYTVLYSYIIYKKNSWYLRCGRICIVRWVSIFIYRNIYIMQDWFFVLLTLRCFESIWCNINVYIKNRYRVRFSHVQRQFLWICLHNISALWEYMRCQLLSFIWTFNCVTHHYNGAILFDFFESQDVSF